MDMGRRGGREGKRPIGKQLGYPLADKVGLSGFIVQQRRLACVSVAATRANEPP